MLKKEYKFVPPPVESEDKPDENAKLQISYETFVESLDDEDSFTTRLVEILLKVREFDCRHAHPC